MLRARDAESRARVEALNGVAVAHAVAKWLHCMQRAAARPGPGGRPRDSGPAESAVGMIESIDSDYGIIGGASARAWRPGGAAVTAAVPSRPSLVLSQANCQLWQN